VWPKEFEKHSSGEFTVVPCEVKGKRISVEQKAAIAESAYEEHDKVVIVVNYESAWRNSMGEFITSVHWDRIILDESHRAKQFDGKLGRFVGELRHHATKRNILTGTLMPRCPMDVFSQYLFLDPNIFGTNFYKFRNQYAIMGGWGGKQIVGYQNQDEMHEKIYSIAFRVTKDILDLPEEQHIIRDFDMNDEAWGYYQQANSELGIVLGEDKIRTDVVLVQLLRMQQITSGYLPVYREWYDDNDKLHHELDRVEKIDSGKAELLEEILDDIGEEPVVVFCRFQHDLDEIKAAAEKLGRTYGEISGRSKSALSDKAELQDNIQIAGVQIQAGGVGIDLTRARYGIYYSVGYSLGDYEQSLARIHRPGQEKPVIYYHLIASGTVDETVYSNLSSKRDVVKSIMEKRND
jgi:SNF2 family DNA or RNA helicase